MHWNCYREILPFGLKGALHWTEGIIFTATTTTIAITIATFIIYREGKIASCHGATATALIGNKPWLLLVM